MTYLDFFRQLTGNSPFPYQVRLTDGEWPEVIDIPTGLGKTAAVVVAWLYRLLERPAETGRRLVYCLPMRVLVDQTANVAQELCSRAEAQFAARGVPTPTVHSLLGGFVDERWEEAPEAPAILVGTQDMLLSRALDRGYAMSRYKWPIQFGLLHNDCVWVLDETQLIGVGVETSAQLEGLRRRFGTFGPAHTIWMSATLGRAQLTTIDHPEPSGGFRVLSLDGADREAPLVQQRTGARKPLSAASVKLAPKGLDAYVSAVAELAADAHRDRGELTLVVLNRVDRAQAVYQALRRQGVEPAALVHSRFRPTDRARHEALLNGTGARVVVATQAVEAGLDVSARTLVTELAPWPSLVQRFGRCNRYGKDGDARALWLDLDVEEDQQLALPYMPTDLAVARTLLAGLGDVGPARLERVEYSAPRVTRPVLRRRDLVDLFDTSPDLLGNDVDVSRFVRDGDDTDVQVYFRAFDEPDEEMAAPSREELVRVSLGAAGDFLKRLEKKRASLGDGERDRARKRWLRAWTWSPIGRSPWARSTSAYPGQILLLHCGAGGYNPELGWTGELLPKRPVDELTAGVRAPTVRELMDADPRTAIDRWVTLQRHLSDVEREARDLAAAVGLPDDFLAAVATAALWHDLGKAHAEFQRRLIEPVRDDPALAPPGDGPWAKSAHNRRPPKGSRPYFRHELASALAWLQVGPEGPRRDLIAYLIAAHHGKIRLSIRSVPDERRPPQTGRLFARGVWDGDALPGIELSDGTAIGPLVLDLSPMKLGEGSWLERTVALRDDPELGPFRLAFLEAIVRVADWRASDKERRDA